MIAFPFFSRHSQVSASHRPYPFPRALAARDRRRQSGACGHRLAARTPGSEGFKYPNARTRSVSKNLDLHGGVYAEAGTRRSRIDSRDIGGTADVRAGIPGRAGQRGLGETGTNGSARRRRRGHFVAPPMESFPWRSGFTSLADGCQSTARTSWRGRRRSCACSLGPESAQGERFQTERFRCPALPRTGRIQGTATDRSRNPLVRASARGY